MHGMTQTAELEAERADAARRYQKASTGLIAAETDLQAARGRYRISTLEVNFAAWRWGRAVNELHGPSALPDDIMTAYCRELGLSEFKNARGQATGAAGVGTMRRLAARVTGEDHLRELTDAYGNYHYIAESFATGETAEELKARKNSNRPSSGYGRYTPPQEWSGYLVQQGLSRREIAGAMRVSLEAVGAEESFKLWDRAGRPST